MLAFDTMMLSKKNIIDRVISARYAIIVHIFSVHYLWHSLCKNQKDNILDMFQRNRKLKDQNWSIFLQLL